MVWSGIRVVARVQWVEGDGGGGTGHGLRRGQPCPPSMGALPEAAKDGASEADPRLWDLGKEVGTGG